MDVLGQLIRNTGHFKGKGRLITHWMAHHDTAEPRTVDLPGGCRVVCDLTVPYEAMVWLRHEETADLQTLSRLLRPGQSFVDCGANIGIWSMVAAVAVGRQGKVYSFEPNPQTLAKLIANLRRNNLGQAKIIHAALGDTEGECFFEPNPQHNISHVVADPTTTSIRVPLVSLDGSLGDTPVDGMKIDVEGYEIAVLRGAQQLLSKYHPWLCIEFNTEAAGVSVLGEWEVHQHLSKLGYVAHRMEDAMDPMPSKVLPVDWQTKGYCNLFYVMPL